MKEDKYWVYRPMLDLIGYTEGTDKGDGYNETLAYGKFTGGDVGLTKMTLRQVDALQTKMLKHPDNNWNSSAVGRYQIVRTTLRSIRQTLALEPNELFNEEMQDRMACYLLGVRGIDKWLAGRMSDKTIISNLAAEWASLPMPNGKGKYGGQHAAVPVSRVEQALQGVKLRHAQGQPMRPIPREVEKVLDDADKGLDSTTIGGGLLSIVSTIFLGFGDLDRIVQLSLLGMIGAAGAYIVFERMRKAKAAREAKVMLK